MLSHIIYCFLSEHGKSAYEDTMKEKRVTANVKKKKKLAIQNIFYFEFIFSLRNINFTCALNLLFLGLGLFYKGVRQIEYHT